MQGCFEHRKADVLNHGIDNVVLRCSLQPDATMWVSCQVGAGKQQLGLHEVPQLLKIINN
jgi:hypothetical protein